MSRVLIISSSFLVCWESRVSLSIKWIEATLAHFLHQKLSYILYLGWYTMCETCGSKKITKMVKYTQCGYIVASTTIKEDLGRSNTRNKIERPI